MFPSSKLAYLYQPNWYTNVVKYGVFCPVVDCGILSLHLWVSDIMHALVLGICHSQLNLYILVLLVLGLIVLAMCIIIPSPFAWRPIRSCCTNLLSNSTPKAIMICCFVGILVPLWIVVVAQLLCNLRGACKGLHSSLTCNENVPESN